MNNVRVELGGDTTSKASVPGVPNPKFRVLLRFSPIPDLANLAGVCSICSFSKVFAQFGTATPEGIVDDKQPSIWAR